MPDSSRGPNTKTCIFCGEDCSTRPRIKDRRGKYACQSCWDQRRRHKRAGAEPQVEASSGRARPLEDIPGAEEGDVHSAASDAPYNIENTLSAQSEARPCPQCGRLKGALSEVCGHCGYDDRVGMPAAAAAMGVGEPALTGEDDGPQCESCGYSLKGLTSARCPECGTKILPKRRRRLHDEADVTRWEYIKPALMLLIGASTVAGILLVQDDADAAVHYLLSYLVHVPFGVGVFFLCCVLWIGFDAPLHLTALRLAGIYAIVDLVLYVTSMIPGVAFFAWLIGLAAYVGLLSEMLELELIDAAAVAIITFLVKMTVALVLFGMWLSDGLGV